MISAARGQEVSPAGLKRGVAVGVVLDHGRPGVHDLDGLLGVAAVLSDVPGQREGVGGYRVLALVGAAVVGVGVRAALHDGAWLCGAGERGVLAGQHLVVRALPGLGSGLHLGADEVELGAADEDAGVGEGGRGRGRGGLHRLRGDGGCGSVRRGRGHEDRGEQGGQCCGEAEAAPDGSGTHVGCLPVRRRFSNSLQNQCSSQT